VAAWVLLLLGLQLSQSIMLLPPLLLPPVVPDVPLLLLLVCLDMTQVEHR
jgi:hypothetical protein